MPNSRRHYREIKANGSGARQVSARLCDKEPPTTPSTWLKVIG